MAHVVKTAWLTSAVTRLTGDSGKPCNEGSRHRVVLGSSDGHRCGVSVQINTHSRDAPAYQVNEIADRWCIDRDEIGEVLTNWTRDQLVAHLATKTKAELMPPRANTR